MGRFAVGRAPFFVASAGLLLAQAVAGCGSTQTPGEAKGGSGAEAGSSDEGGSIGTGGSPGDGGTGDSGGSPGASGGASVSGSGGRGGAGAAGFSAGGTSGGAGRPNTTGGKGNAGGAISASGGTGNVGGAGGFVAGGVGGASAGAPGCIEGAPCKCKKLVGITECTAAGATCSCPPAAECAPKADAPCFEPCGGEPFGGWVLTDACFGPASGTQGNGACETLLEGASGDTDLRLRILDGGEMQLGGSEDWSISAQISLACISVASVNSCSKATFWPDSLLFSTTQPATCTANACGVCDCTSDAHAEVNPFFDFDRWSRDGTNLQLGSRTVPYCVTGDELWIGGSNSAGTPKVSYKFKKQSCTGTPVACSARTTAQCTKGPNCWVGACKPTTGTLPRCATVSSAGECGVLQGCTWDPTGCAGTASESCEFDNCETELGCTWGAPRERCGGYAWSCEERDVGQCAGSGCAVRPCLANFSDYGECQLLGAADCAKAPGCSVAAGTGTCIGQARCIDQTDAAVCGKLGNCLAQPNCGGTPSECSSLSLAACQSVPGCRMEW